MAGAYYWHRFYHHQPDLNFDNPAVEEAVLEVLEHWLDMGVDGLRLDAVPYLYEREAPTARTSRDPRLPAPAPQPPRLRATTTRCSWRRPTSGPRTRRSTSATATSAT
ncbi:MAG: alpha-amylase family glycosyl hydrolase [Microthrixaceae bacterium]